MKKIAIITELNRETTNYGNRLQAFALNKFLNSHYTNVLAETVLFNEEFKFTKISMDIIINKIKLVFKQKEKKDTFLLNRKINCNSFTDDTTITTSKVLTIKEIENDNYDIFIAGSDVVWSQLDYKISKMRFLNINTNGKKYSYAASFGKDWIPKNNIRYVRKNLQDFDGITVREKSSVDMLKKIGIFSRHVCDPTLLLEKDEYIILAKKPKEYDQSKFIFVYLLGKDKEMRESIKLIAKKNNLKIISIPYANGEYDDVDKDFADINIMDCSPYEWIWLVKNCEYMITDSFHGLIFSTIFEKKFFVTSRCSKMNINNRMVDYLSTIGEQNKFVDLSNLDLNMYKWDYKEINSKIIEFKNKSIEYLNEILKEKEC